MNKRLCLLLFCLLPGIVAAAPDAAREQRLKAAFLYNFAKYVEWPAASFADAQAPLRLCVQGDSDFAEVLRQVVETRTLGQRSLMVRALLPDEAALGCHVLYSGALPAVAPTDPLPLLTVGNGDTFVAAGGMIAFIQQDNRIRFLVNRSAAQQADLSISSRLLKLASGVR